MSLPTWMVRARSAIRLVTGFARRAEQDAELDDEMLDHIERATERHVRNGMAPNKARRQALVAFGGQAQWTEASRDEQRSRLFDDFARDLRYGAAGLRRNPGFAAGGVITIALAIAAVATVFNFVSAVYLRSLPVPEGSRLVNVHEVVSATREGSLGYPAFERLRERTKTLDLVAAHYSTSPLYMSARGESGEVPGAVVSADYFRMLGLRPALGRFFVPAEDSVRDRDAVAVLGFGMWQARFAADSQIVGEHISINGRSFTVIGVAPSGFEGVVGGMVNTIWIPMAMLRTGYRYCDGYQFSCRVTDMLARLAPGATLAEAQAEASALRATLMAGADTASAARPIRVEPVLGIRDQEQLQYTNLSRLLWAIAIVLMLVACANLAGLLLARGMTRQREFSLRASLGAGRWRIVRQLLVESLVLGAAGGVAGVGLTIVASRALAEFFATTAYRPLDLPFDGRVLAFVACATIVMVLCFGLFPALRVSKVDVSEALKSGGTRASNRARFALIIGQSALAVALLSTAGLLSRSFARVMAGESFDPSHIALVRLRPAIVDYSVERSTAYFQLAVAKIQAVPGVVAAAPIRGYPNMRAVGGPGDIAVALPGSGSTAADAPRVYSNDVGPNYFSALRVPLVSGREFSERDTPSNPLVTIVDETLALRLWGSTNVVGRSVMFEVGGSGGGGAWKTFQVVGVLKDYRLRAFGEAAPPMVYFAFWQMPSTNRDARIVIRAEGDPTRTLASIRRAAESADPNVPVTESTALEGVMRRLFAEVALGGVVLSASAALTLFLAAVGLYGVVSFLVTQRRREIAVRLAIGARPGEVVAMLLRQGLSPILAGGLIGIGVSIAAGPLLAQWLFGISPIDAATIIAALSSVFVVAVLASYLPARRAAGTDPASVFRSD